MLLQLLATFFGLIAALNSNYCYNEPNRLSDIVANVDLTGCEISFQMDNFSRILVMTKYSAVLQFIQSHNDLVIPAKLQEITRKFDRKQNFAVVSALIVKSRLFSLRL